MKLVKAVDRSSMGLIGGGHISWGSGGNIRKRKYNRRGGQKLFLSFFFSGGQGTRYLCMGAAQVFQVLEGTEL